MQINIILPYKEKFSKNKASSVSITVKHNFDNSFYKKKIKIYGQYVMDPILPLNFIGIKKPLNFLKSKNIHLAEEMCEIINNNKFENHLIEIHNRPYLVKFIDRQIKDKSIILFFHNDPLNMKGSKLVSERLDLLSRVNYICCVSNFIKNQFLKGIKYNDDKVIVIHNGVSREINKFPQKKKEIIYVGRIVKEKGVHLFVEAIKQVYSELNLWNFKIVGSVKLGDNNYLDVYSKKVTSEFTNLGKRAEFKGYISPNKLKKIMQSASIIVIPSIWEEPFGLIAAEAMANGIAIISSNRGGLKEIVGKTGFLLKDIDETKIIRSLLKLTNNEQELLKYQNLSWNNFTFTSKISSKKLDKIRSTIFEN